MSSLVGPDEDDPRGKPPVPDDVQEAIRTLIRWAGDDPDARRPASIPRSASPARGRNIVVGYTEDPAGHLTAVFEEVGGYDEIVLLKDIPFQSHCEHHMAPIIGKAAIAYLPTDHVVGISKLARVLHGFARRLQIQERLTAEVAQCIWDNLEAARGGSGDRGQPCLHDRARRAHAGRDHGHQPGDGHLPQRPAQPRGSAQADGLLTGRMRYVRGMQI